MALFAVSSGLMEDVSLERVGDFEEQLLRYLNATHPAISQTIGETGSLSDESKERLTAAINDFKPTFS